MVELHLQPEVLEQAVHLLVSGIECTEAVPGCCLCAVTQDVGGKAQRVFYREEWESEPAFVRHLQSEEFRRVLTVMDMCSSEPLVRIGDLSGRSGLDYLRELRGSHSVVEE